jgi:hypothetical protein
MKLARTVTRYEDFVEELTLNIVMTDALISAALVCPVLEGLQRSATIEVIEADVGHIRVTIPNSTFEEFCFEDVYLVLNMFKLNRIFNPLNMHLMVRKDF